MGPRYFRAALLPPIHQRSVRDPASTHQHEYSHRRRVGRFRHPKTFALARQRFPAAAALKVRSGSSAADGTPAADPAAQAPTPSADHAAPPEPDRSGPADSDAARPGPQHRRNRNLRGATRHPTGSPPPQQPRPSRYWSTAYRWTRWLCCRPKPGRSPGVTRHWTRWSFRPVHQLGGTRRWIRYWTRWPFRPAHQLRWIRWWIRSLYWAQRYRCLPARTRYGQSGGVPPPRHPQPHPPPPLRPGMHPKAPNPGSHCCPSCFRWSPARCDGWCGPARTRTARNHHQVANPAAALRRRHPDRGRGRWGWSATAGTATAPARHLPPDQIRTGPGSCCCWRKPEQPRHRRGRLSSPARTRPCRPCPASCPTRPDPASPCNRRTGTPLTRRPSPRRSPTGRASGTR